MASPVHRLVPLLLAALLLATVASLLPAQQNGLRAGESVQETADAFPGAEPRDAQGHDTIWCVRILDAVDRRPIPGALVMVPRHPRGGVVDAELHHQCIGIADEYGWARLPWPAVQGWDDYVFADAPGYAANEECLPGAEECRLQRGTDVPVELIDYTGRPVPGGRIELVLGCGHVPCQRSVTADASGRATLPMIWPSRHEDFFVWAPQCQYGSYRLRRTWRPGDPPVPIDVVPGRTAEGRIVDRNGAAVVGARVGAHDGEQERQRPWTRTDRDGRFRLVGLSFPTWPLLAVQPPPHLGLVEQLFTAPPPGVECTVVLGRVTTTRDVRVQARAANGVPAAGVRIVAVRTDDGLTATEVTDEDGNTRLALPAGRYRLSADGELGPFGRCAREIDVGETTAEPVDLTVPKNPTVRVDTSRILGMTLGITTATLFRELDPDEVDGTDVPIPDGERATFRVSTHEDGELLVNFVEIPGPGATLVIEGPPQTHIRARFVGPDGKPVAASLEIRRELGSFRPERGGAAEDATEVADVATRLVGTISWIASPQDESLAQVHGDVVVRSGVDTDLGEIRLLPPRAAGLTVALPDDLKGTGGSVSGTRTRAHGGAWGEIDEDGVVAAGFGDFAAGDLLWIQPAAPHALPFRFVAPGPPPWQVRYPASALTIALRSGKDLPLTKAVVILDGQIVRKGFAESASLRLRGVAKGPHTLVVAAPAHLAQVYHLVLHDDEQRVLDVTLNPRDG